MSRRRLYRLPEQGMIRGVCAGIADYFDIPVKLVRILAVLSLFFGLFVFTAVIYLVLSLLLDPAPEGMNMDSVMHFNDLYPDVVRDLRTEELRIRQIERYVTSERFNLNSRFRQL